MNKDIYIKPIDNKDDWDKYTNQCINFNIYHLFEWGEYKKTSWQIARLAVFKNESLLGCVQITYKNKFKFLLGWCSGGIALKNYKYLNDIATNVKDYFSNYRHCIRVNFFDNATGTNSFTVDNCSILKPIKNSINSGYTVRFEINNDTDILKNMSYNNRYYYKQSLINDLIFKRETVDPETFTTLHNSMAQTKGMENLTISSEEIKKLLKIYGDILQMYSVYNHDELLSSCLIFKFKKYAYYYLAGSNEKGRKFHASFFMVKELLELLKSEEITNFDFSGITPFKSEAFGVNRFKIGFGGEIIKYIGEREIYNSKLMKYTLNKLVKRLN